MKPNISIIKSIKDAPDDKKRTLITNWLTDWQSAQTVLINKLERSCADDDKNIEKLRLLTKVRFKFIKELIKII